MQETLIGRDTMQMTLGGIKIRWDGMRWDETQKARSFKGDTRAFRLSLNKRKLCSRKFSTEEGLDAMELNVGKKDEIEGRENGG